MTAKTQDWIRKLPKAELHVHLEGAVSPDTLVQLAKKYQLELPTSSDALQQLFAFSNFEHFLKVYLMISTCLRDKDDFRLLAKAHLKKASEQGILYSEVEWTPNTLLKNGVSYQEQIEGLIEGIREGEEAYGVTMRLLADIIPGEGTAPALSLLKELEANPHNEVVGFSIGGPEIDYLHTSFHDVYERARGLGLHTAAHAGETAGPEAVWEAIQNLKVDRIAHGCHAPQDPKLMKYLAEHHIPLDVCPTSNLKLGYFESYLEHPIRLFFDRGIPITLNSDDPALFGQNLAQEYATLLQEGIFTTEELKQIAEEGFKQAFAPEALKQEYLAKLGKYPIN